MEIVRFGKLEEDKLLHLVPEAAVQGVDAAVLALRFRLKNMGLSMPWAVIHVFTWICCRVLSELLSRDGLGRREDVEEKEREEADPEHGGDGKQDPAHYVVDHYFLLLM